MLSLLLMTAGLSAPSAAQPAAAPPSPAGLAPADSLATQVAQAAGNPYTVPQLEFTFVVTVADQQKVARRHRWCPAQGLVDVDGVRISAIDGSAIGDATADAAEAAWGAFVNDGYWLLAPSKVMDPGVQRSIDDQGRLVLTFAGVGLTPGDSYALTVDPQTHKVTRWAFVLQSGREGAFGWTDWQQHGPLTLSGTRTTDDGATVIQLSDLAVADACAL